MKKPVIGSFEKVSWKSEEKMQENIKTTLQKDKNLVHLEQQEIEQEIELFFLL